MRVRVTKFHPTVSYYHLADSQPISASCESGLKSSRICCAISVDGRFYGVGVRPALWPKSTGYKRARNQSSDTESRVVDYEQVLSHQHVSGLMPEYDDLDNDYNWALVALDKDALRRLYNDMRKEQFGTGYLRGKPNRGEVARQIGGSWLKKGLMMEADDICAAFNGDKHLPCWRFKDTQEDLSKHYEATFKDAKSIIDVEGGSIVVRPDNGLLYGMICCGTEHGKVFVSPFYKIMEQLDQCFPGREVVFATPEVIQRHLSGISTHG